MSGCCIMRKCFSQINQRSVPIISQLFINHVCNPVPTILPKCFTFSTELHRSMSSTSTCSKNSIRQNVERKPTGTGPYSMSNETVNLQSFDGTYRDIYEDLTLRNHSLPALVNERLGRILNYNILGGKKIRGLTVVLAYNMLSNTSDTTQDVKLSEILGWCVEILQGFFIVADDIMDDGKMRRGQPCWFRVEDVGLQAINDSLLLEAAIYRLLKMHFSGFSCYNKLIDEFHEVTSRTINGQCLDMATNPMNTRPSFEKLTSTNYKYIVEHKTSHYTYCLPVHLAMHLIGGFSSSHYESTKAICLKLGYLFQMQDDYLDIYGDPAITGKVGTDIKDGKCTWFSSMAFENSSPEDKNLMEKFFGVNNDTAVEKVLQHFESLSLRKKYREMEEKLKDEITDLISQLDAKVLNRHLFEILLNAIYKRNK